MALGNEGLWERWRQEFLPGEARNQSLYQLSNMSGGNTGYLMQAGMQSGQLPNQNMAALGRRIDTAPVAVMEAPERVAVELEDGIDQEYVALAKQVGLELSVLTKHTLLSFLHENGYSTYEYERVAKYMDNVCAREDDKHRSSEGYLTTRTAWGWRSLRKHDPVWSTITQDWSMMQPYDKPIPMPVLRTVAEIAGKLPEARFYVTDYYSRVPDPFLSITLPGMTDLIVLERWLEPSFR